MINGGASAISSVVLTAQPLSNVLINISLPQNVKASTSSLTFSSSDWNIAQTVTLSAISSTSAPASGVLTYTAKNNLQNDANFRLV